MARGSDNPFPSVLIVEGTAPAAPAAGDQRIYIDSTTHHLSRKDSSASIVDLETAQSGAVTQIQQQLLLASAASITFSAIPGTHNHLRLIVQGRSDAAAVGVNVSLQFNADTGANYDSEELDSYSNSVQSADTAAGATSVNVFAISAASAPAGMAGISDLLIPNYAGTTFYKQVRAMSANFRSTTTTGAYLSVVAAQWRSTAAITSIKIFPASGNFIAGTMATLYGLS